MNSLELYRDVRRSSREEQQTYLVCDPFSTVQKQFQLAESEQFLSSGRRIVYLAGNAIYGAFTLIASFMPNQAGFFACRGVSGLGATMVSASIVGTLELLASLSYHPELSLSDFASPQV